MPVGSLLLCRVLQLVNDSSNNPVRDLESIRHFHFSHAAADASADLFPCNTYTPTPNPYCISCLLSLTSIIVMVNMSLEFF